MGRTHLLVLVNNAPMSFVCQQLMVFECDLFTDANPFSKMLTPDLYARQCPYATVVHIPSESQVEIARACPLFPEDRGPIDPTKPTEPLRTISIDLSQFFKHKR